MKDEVKTTVSSSENLMEERITKNVTDLIKGLADELKFKTVSPLVEKKPYDETEDIEIMKTI